MLYVNFFPFPVLTTQRLVLRKMGDKDKQSMFAMRSNPDVMQFIGRAVTKTIEEAHQLIIHVNNLLDNNEAINWAIKLKDNPEMIGTICLWNIQKEHYRAELGYMLNPDFHRQGIMQEAIATVLDYGFNTLKLHSIEARTSPDNIASIRVLEKNNFIREGYLKENYCINGQFTDTVIYSLVNA